MGAGNLVFGVFAGGGLGLFGLASSGKLAGGGLELFGPASFGLPAGLAAIGIGLVAGLARGFVAGWKKRVRGRKVGGHGAPELRRHRCADTGDTGASGERERAAAWASLARAW